MDELIQDEVKDFNSFLEHDKIDRPMSVKDMFNIPILSSLWTIVTGKRASRSDSTMVHLTESMTKQFEVGLDINNLWILIDNVPVCYF